MIDNSLEKKEACDNALLSMLGSEEMVARWWCSPNIAFSLQPPIYAWKNNQSSVIEYISKHCSM